VESANRKRSKKKNKIMKFKVEPMGVQAGKLMTKCYYQDGEDYGEFYINFIDGVREGEILQKNSDYADVLLKAFAKEFSKKQVCPDCNGQYAHCTKCGEHILGDEDSLCINCIG